MSEKVIQEQLQAALKLIARMDKELQECRSQINRLAARVEQLEHRTEPLNLYGGRLNK